MITINCYAELLGEIERRAGVEQEEAKRQRAAEEAKKEAARKNGLALARAAMPPFFHEFLSERDMGIYLNHPDIAEIRVTFSCSLTDWPDAARPPHCWTIGGSYAPGNPTDIVDIWRAAAARKTGENACQRELKADVADVAEAEDIPF